MLTRRQIIVLVTPFLLIVIPFLIWPAIWGIGITFTNYSPTQLQLRFVGLNNYVHLLQSSSFQAAIRNAVSFTLITVIAQLSFGVSVAFLVQRMSRMRGVLRIIMLLPWLISPIATGVMWHYLLNMDNGIFNYWPALLGLPHTFYPLQPGYAFTTVCIVEIWRKVPLVVFLVLPSILAIPRDSWDIARLDGLRWYGQLRYVVLPRVRVLLATISLLLIGDALGTSESLFTLTGGGPGTQTTLPGMFSFQSVFVAHNWIDGATSAWLIVATVLIIGTLYIVFTRRERAI